ncbi:MAG: outer membrane beta-barrel protein [Acidobacteria bacterium]|nr:outer membrane beta-barrel protein [Acidobacteriota bacterium]
MAGSGPGRWTAVLGLTVALVAGVAALDVQAQTIGIGPRMVFISGENSPIQDPNDTSKTKFTGGFLRLRASKHMGFEISMDYRTATNPSETARVRTTPIQGTVLFYPFRTAIAPYILGGIGWYKERYEALSDGQPVLTTNTSQIGYHTGMGAEMMMGKHASIFFDYRYTFVNVDGVGGLAGALYSALSLTSVTGLLNSLTNSGTNSNTTMPGVSHQGSMWTTGMTVYF